MFQGRGIVCERGERRIFSNLDFTIAPGGAAVLRGPNGCGKTSLLRIAATLLRAADGQLKWDGGDISEDIEAHRARLHFIGHQDAVKGALTVRENIALWQTSGVTAKAASTQPLRPLIFRTSGIPQRNIFQPVSTGGRHWPASWRPRPYFGCWTSPLSHWTLTALPACSG